MLCYDMVLGRMHTLRARMLMIRRIYRDVWAVVGRLLCLVDAYCVMYGRICTKVYCLWTLTTNGECTLIIYVFVCTNPTQIRINTCCTLCMHTKHGGRLDPYMTAIVRPFFLLVSFVWPILLLHFYSQFFWPLQYFF